MTGHPWAENHHLGARPAGSGRPDGAGAVRGQEDHRRPGRAAGTADRRAARRRPHAGRGGARAGQDAGREVAGRGDRRRSSSASSSPPTWCPPISPAPGSSTRAAATFEVSLGPVFTNLLLADEINRAPAKVQSALLEAMQERQVTIGRETHPLPQPFLVMATQNPIESEGTYPLPEAQVDRFMMKVLVGYPNPTEEFVIVERAISAAPRHPAGARPATAAGHAGAGPAGLRRPGADRLRGAADHRHPLPRPGRPRRSGGTSSSARARGPRST